MSISLYAKAYFPPDEDYNKKVAAWRACEAAKVPIPRELRDFFGDDGPDAAGTSKPLGRNYLGGAGESCHESTTLYHEEMIEGFTIDVTKLPPGTKLIRVYASF